ncbi:peptidase U32 family protein [Vallitalea okinawensis]|uniref:peptidase U32 family protein n=1 Tax=Vallitalea okinawensis TaxID=2078660 RepID=UPI000CFC6DCA|nr:U32 family peptidase [Vallitalea okinawensis]
MSRNFNHQEIELLAPVGNFEIFKDLVNSGADAFFFGGKLLNMRMHRKAFNFSNNEIKEAVHMAHSLDKKVYITVNNLFSQEDLEAAKDYLLFLNDIQPDALIIQDYSLFKIIDSLNLQLNLHSSVMMNVHNLASIKRLRQQGVSRIVASREMDLRTIKTLHSQTDMEFEYFTHGDMCIAHGSQCHYSGMLFGNSSNRGLCMKPCRWSFRTKKDGNVYPTEYPMAVKDLSMYEYLPEMIDAGIVSFKIEGRMRDADYLLHLINCYGDALDRYIHDPFGYDRKKSTEMIYNKRKRDLSTAYAFGNPGLVNINRRYEGTGVFYSHGKVFSKPIEETEISKERVEKIKEVLTTHRKNSLQSPVALSIKVNSYEQAIIALEEGVDSLYLSGDVFEPSQPFTITEIQDLAAKKGQTKLYLGLPRMMYENDFSRYNHVLEHNALGIDGLLVTNLGAIDHFRGAVPELIGDYSLNLYNAVSADYLKEEGLTTGTLSIEAPLKDIIATVEGTQLPTEVIVQGSPVVMYLEHDLYENTKVLDPIGEEDNLHVDNNILVLVNDKGYEHPVYREAATGRNHMTTYKDICYLPFLKELIEVGVKQVRIEACHYSDETLKSMIQCYKEALQNPAQCEELYNHLKTTNASFTLGALQFN